jgi:hypothetical protein
MLREITVSLQDSERVYLLDTDNYYEARVGALKLFLKEFNLPGNPADYLSGRLRGLIRISLRSSIDKRRDEKPLLTSEMLLEQVSSLREGIRVSQDLVDKSKSRATKLLLKVEEVLSGA